MALVPWLLALRDVSRRRAWWSSYLVGLVFFLGSMWWLTKLTAFGGWVAILGWLLLCAYLALYFAVFGWVAHWMLSSRFETRAPRTSHLAPIVALPSCWVALEFARTHLLSGLGWNLLGYSQQPVVPLIQTAALTGVWGVSFLIVMMNVAISLYASNRPTSIRAMSVLLAVGCVLGSRAYGEWRLRQPATAVAQHDGGPGPAPAATVRVAVVQGSIPQEQKWDEEFQAEILSRYERLTRAIAAQHPDVIVWPETAVPALLGVHPEVTARVQGLAQELGVPLVIGAPMTTEVPSAEFRVPSSHSHLLPLTSHLTNSAVLLDADGIIVGRYDKLHLVPFGEFIPFEGVAPWLRDLLPPIGEFVPGHEHTVFTAFMRNAEFGMRNGNPALRTPHSELKFSVLICFEDTFPELARAFVREGARLLMTITNDAWFGPTAAAYQHAQASTFRAVELGVPMIRAANTGWSGCIDAHGRWLASVSTPQGGELFVEGAAVCDVTPGSSPTVYARWGDWFAWGCVLLSGCVIIPCFISHGHHRRSHRGAFG